MTRIASGVTPEAALAATWLALQDRLARARAEERGMTTETVLITAGLAALAVTVVGIIAARVRDRANAIP
ncbi:MAG: hypothetical protein HYU28_05755 [Actinobacteria bacterium]|nr:hypothetical protein [Actinomycetota bacterium]